VATAVEALVDPVKYEIFLHRLWAIGEEGRIALQRVTASPIVAQGGECMSSFYAPDGTMILACSGHLRFAGATSQAIRAIIDWYAESPGIAEGDQFFLNDPYVAGSHTYDQMLIMPIFWEGRLIAWTASSSHTADVGGVLRGQATEIFHEGIRILGLKAIERGQPRDDVFRTIVEQCRDPQYVALDLKSRVAANNVCARAFLQLVEKFGVEFVEAACARIIADTESLARERLRALPDGTWTARMYGTTVDRKTRGVHPYRIVCTTTKRDDTLHFDFTGTSPQVADDMNSTLPSTLAHMNVALTNQLFWDAPWSDGKMAPVSVYVPEGTILNCSFPAACASAPMVGMFLVASVSECLAKMLYAAGRVDDVNATWTGFWYWGGPGMFYGGHNREGIPTAQGIYDFHGSGLGAAPTRDGVPTGGHMNIPTGGISDVERVEMQYPLVYLARNHNPDGFGYGRWQGGAGSYRLYTVYGSRDLTIDYKPYGGIPTGAFGLFGGYPAGCGVIRALFPSETLLDRLRAGERYPVLPDEVPAGGWGEVWCPPGTPERVPIPEGWLVSDFVAGGGGFGDPLDREPERVAADVRGRRLSPRIAHLLYGVVVDGAGALDGAATAARREAIRAERRAAEPASGQTTAIEEGSAASWRPVLRFHLHLAVATDGTRYAVQCQRCGHLYCDAADNYKQYAPRRRRPLEELAGGPLPSGEPYQGYLLEYACPGCATLLQVDLVCPALDDDAPLHDVRFDAAWLARQAEATRPAR